MKFYRYEDVRIANEIGVRVELREFNLVKETPKGYWICPKWDRKQEYKQWVSANGKNRKAYPTKEEALLNYQRRKERQIKILTSRLSDAQSGLHQIPRMELELRNERKM